MQHTNGDGSMHPAFLFDRRIILNHAALEDIGFKVHVMGKRQGPNRKLQDSRTQHDKTLLQLSIHAFNHTRSISTTLWRSSQDQPIPAGHVAVLLTNPLLQAM